MSPVLLYGVSDGSESMVRYSYRKAYGILPVSYWCTVWTISTKAFLTDARYL